jgi:hypothetical protein
MTWRLLIRERGIRSMVWLIIGLAAGLVLVALVRKPPGGLPFLPDWFRPQYFYYPALYHWAYLAGFAGYAGVTGRSNRLCLALPITACSLWWSRFLAVVLGGVAIVAVQYGVLVLVGLIQGQSLVDEALRSLAIGLISCYVLAVLLAQLPCISLSEVPLRPGYFAYLIGVWVITLALVTFVSAYPYLVLVPLALACALILHIRRVLPDCFALAGREPVPPGPAGRDDASRSGRARGRHPSQGAGMACGSDPAPGGRGRVSALLRVLYHPWLTLLLFMWLAFVGLRNAGYGFGGLSNTTMVLWALLALSGLMSYALPRLCMVDALPVSRNVLFAYLIIPGLAVALGSYTVGTVRAKGLFAGRQVVTYGAKYYDQRDDVRVPLEYWEISPGGNPPPVEGCCDEAHATWSTELVRGTGLILHSPYHVPPGSPPELVAGQLSLAIEAVYGARVPPAELIQRYFDRGPDGGAVLKVETMNLERDYPGLKTTDWMRTLPLVYILVGVPWFLYLSLVMGPLRSRAPGKSVLTGHLVITFAAMGFLLLMIWASSNGITKEYKVSAAVGILIRKAADAIPGGTASLWVLSLAVLVVAYLGARSRFLRYEFPAKPGGRAIR